MTKEVTAMKTALVFEGGTIRGLFTADVIDILHKNGILVVL